MTTWRFLIGRHRFFTAYIVFSSEHLLSCFVSVLVPLNSSSVVSVFLNGCGNEASKKKNYCFEHSGF